MITVEFERARGLHQVCQKVDGYSGSASRTLADAAAALLRLKAMLP